MEDHEIIALYHRRSEDAIAATDEKYGPPLPPPQPSGQKNEAAAPESARPS